MGTRILSNVNNPPKQLSVDDDVSSITSGDELYLPDSASVSRSSSWNIRDVTDYDERDPAQEQFEKAVSFGLGFASIVTEHLISHPCIVLRRQCQVNPVSRQYHILPFSLFSPMANLYRHQGVSTMWKGIGSIFVARGISLVTETAISEVTPLPKELPEHASWKRISQHLLLKGISFAITSPFYAASFIETVQCTIASERPGMFDCVTEGLSRVRYSLPWGSNTSAGSRLVSLYRLVLPTALYGTLHYAIMGIAQFAVLLIFRDINEDERPATIYRRPSQRHTNYYARAMLERYLPELVASFSAHLVADTLLYPMETVLHRLYLQGTRCLIDNLDNGTEVLAINTYYEGFTDCLSKTVNSESVLGLCKGFGALVLQYSLHLLILRGTHFVFQQIASRYASGRNQAFRS